MERSEYFNNYPVTVIQMRLGGTSKCNIRGCDNKDKYTVCIGLPRLSTVNLFCCANHLSLAVDKSLKERERQWEKYSEKNKEVEIEKAKLLIENLKNGK